MRSARAVTMLAAAWLGAVACSQALPRGVDGLRRHLAAEPTDLRAHLALARALDRADLPGGARRHFQVVDRNGALGDAGDRARYAALLVERARARIALGDAGAAADLARAGELGAAAAELAPLVREAGFLVALAAYRRGDPASQAEGDRLAAAGAGDARAAAARPKTAPLTQLARAAAWLDRGGARRAALARYEQYLRRGGRDPAALSAYARLHRWWHGERRGLEAAVVAAVLDTGADTCLGAPALGAPGCSAATLAEVAREPARARALARRAARLGWRTADPQAAGAIALLALRRWLAGDTDGWGVDVAALVDLERACAQPALLPRYAAPTLLRLAGRADAAAAALDEVLTRPPADALERAAVLVEAAVQGREAGLPALAGPALGDPLLAAAVPRVRAARAQPAPFDDARAAARWYHAVAGVPGRDRLAARWGLGPVPAPALPLSVVDARRLADAHGAGAELGAELEAIAAAYQRDRAAADRLARRFADAGALGERGPLLLFLFRELGDAGRALAWAEELVARSPEHAPYLLWAGAAAAAAGHPERAQLYLTRGAAQSGDAGAALTTAAARFLAAEQPVYALAAAKQALALTAAGEAQDILALVVDAASALGRDALAADARGRLPIYARARDELLASGDAEALAALCARDPTDAAAAAAYLRAAPQAAADAAERAAAFNPRHVELLAAAAQTLPEPAASQWLLRAAAAAAATDAGFPALAAAATARGHEQLAAAAGARVSF